MEIDHRIRRRLKLRDLDTVLAVAQCGSMAKAAGQLAISQPAVSKAIADLEHMLGVRLFDRTAQGVAPSLYGHALIKWAVAVFDDVRQGVKEIEFLADPTAGELRIGATEPMMGGFLPAVLARLCERHPRIVFDVIETTSESHRNRALAERQVDLVLGRIAPTGNDEEIATEVLFDEPQAVVVGAQNPLARRRRLELMDLVNEPWTIPPSDTVAGAHVWEFFKTTGLGRPRAVVTCRSIQMHYALLTSGPFLALFPRSVLHFNANRLSIKVLPVKLTTLPPAVGVVTLKNRVISPVTQLFIDCAREVAKSLQRAFRSPSRGPAVVTRLPVQG
jgi:DNA-binding transcriptional LysR family regulator